MGNNRLNNLKGRAVYFVLPVLLGKKKGAGKKPVSGRWAKKPLVAFLSLINNSEATRTRLKSVAGFRLKKKKK